MTAPSMAAKWPTRAPYLLSVLRIVAAFLFMQFGSAKLFAFPAAIMPGGGTAPITSLPGIAGTLEVFGGLFLLVGLFTRPVAFVLSGEMAIAYFLGHAPQGFWPVLNQGHPAILIEHRPKALWRVAQEIRYGHLTREDEGHGPRKQSDEEEEAAEDLERPGDAGQRRDRRGAPARHDGRRKREQLGRPELHEEECGDDPEDAEQVRRPRRPFRRDAWCGHDTRLTFRSLGVKGTRPPVDSHEPPRISSNPTTDIAPRCSSSTTTPSRTATKGLMYVMTLARLGPASAMS